VRRNVDCGGDRPDELDMVARIRFRTGRNPALAGMSVGDQPGRVLTPDETGSLGLAHLATRQHDPGIVLLFAAT